MKRALYQLGVISLIFALLISDTDLFGGISPWLLGLQACTTIEECDAQNDALAAKKRKLEKQLRETRRQQNNLHEEMALLMDSVKALDEQLIALRNGIAKLIEEIAYLEDIIVTKENDVKKLLQQQQKEANDNIYLSMLISARSISDFMVKMNAVGTINGARQKYIITLQEDKDKLDQSKIKLDESREQAEASKAEQEALIAESQVTLQKLNALAAQMKDRIGDIEMSQDEINKQRAILGGGVPSANGWYLPAATGWLTCSIGCYYDHIGNDFGMRVGTPVYAIANGTVVYTQRSTATTGYGTMITIAHDIGGVPHISIYGHLSSLGVRAGDIVRGGQQIARSGNTGASDGPHLHLEIIRNTNVFVNKPFRRRNLVDALKVLPKPARGWRLGW